MFRSYQIFILLCFWVQQLNAQLNLSSTSNASTLVNNIVGAGVQVTNVTLNCNGQASGTFSSSGSNIGLSSGIILATGNIHQAAGTNNSTGDNSIIASNNANCFNSDASFSDPNLSSIEPEAKYDGCILEFDIKPVCDKIEIKYVFASEEYPEYVCSAFNDAFGFFITGPKPGGGNYSAQNVATLPNGQAVSINNVNNGSPGDLGALSNCGSLSNTAYYVDNTGGSTIQYDGFTVPLTASVDVIQCSNYHLKFVIADAGDCQFSSAVFLANSGVGCPNALLPHITTITTPVNCGNDGTATVSVTNSQGPITYNWQPGGQTTATAANLGPGTYTCTLGFSQPCPYTKPVVVTLSGDNLLTLTTSSTNSYCGDSSGTASVVVSGGLPPYSLPSWNTIPPQTTNTINSLTPDTISVTVSDASGCVFTKDVIIGNTIPNITISETITNATCNSTNGEIIINSIAGGTSPYQYNWSTNPISTSQNLLNTAAGSYSFTVTDVEGCAKTEVYDIINVDSVLISISTIDEYCNKANGEIHVDLINGIAPYTWAWSHDTILNDSIATGLSSGLYTFTVTDDAGCQARGTATIVNIRDLFPGQAYTNPEIPAVNINFALGISLPSNWDVTQILLADSTSYFNEQEITLNYGEYGYYNATFYVLSNNGCLDTIEYTFFVKDFMTVYIPNAFSPNKDVRNNVWYVYGTLIKNIDIYVFNRWGEQVFESHDIEKGWDGTYKGKMCQEDTYIYKVVAKDYFDENKKFVGHINLFR